MPRSAGKVLRLLHGAALCQQGAATSAVATAAARTGVASAAGLPAGIRTFMAAASNAGARTAGGCSACGKHGAHCCACGKATCSGHPLTTSAAAAQAAEPAVAVDSAEGAASLGERARAVQEHFPSAMAVDDLMARVEMALAAYGFTGDNTIAMSNLCRDESCMIVEDKIEAVFGSCFSTHGLGGVLTCGVIGMKAGLSHSPVEGGKERYVFFSFPHIAIDSNGKVGAISRPNRPGASAACGALIKTMMDLQADGLKAGELTVGTHDPHEPEFSILKSRVSRMVGLESRDPKSMTLVDFTKAAERVITADLEFLISQAVDPAKADYAVVTGVQIHNWAADLEDSSTPSMEFVAPASVYVVVDGKKTELDLNKVPSLSPRQLQLLASKTSGGAGAGRAAATGSSTLQEIPRDYLMRRLGGVQGSAASNDMPHGGPAWRKYIEVTYKA